MTTARNPVAQNDAKKRPTNETTITADDLRDHEEVAALPLEIRRHWLPRFIAMREPSDSLAKDSKHWGARPPPSPVVPAAVGSTGATTALARIRAWVVSLEIAPLLALAVSALGLALRIEHAATFDGRGRGADYERHIAGVNWMMSHWRPFDFTPEVDWSIGYQPPLWYALAALILKWTHSERAISVLAVSGWAIRQFLLGRILWGTAPLRKWSALVALTISAFLPISVLTDGKVNPEGLHTTLFMIAVYALWRMEQQAQQRSGIALSMAAAFGAFSGLAVLTKGTGGLLPMAAAIVLAWRSLRLIREAGWPATWRRLLRPAMCAAAVWCLVAGWWCGPNLAKYGHPFPHAWDRDTAATQPLAATPVFYRRPLGWALPFFWAPYLKAPIMEGAETPRTNLWAMLVAGTWSDLINRGFCRLQGGGTNTHFWDGWPVSGRCVLLLATLTQIGCFVTFAAVLAMIVTARSHLRTAGRHGSLALPVVIVLAVTFTSLFGLSYPFDGTAVVNARYLLPVSGPLSACLGIALAQFQGRLWKRILVHAVMFLAVGAVGLLVVWERWGP